MRTCFTSESVTEGHPDKVCDKVADRILDEILKQDKNAHVACEVAAVTDKLHIMGEITSTANVDYAKAARKAIMDAGYTEKDRGFDSETVKIELDIHNQSPDIAHGVNRTDIMDSGAGDQGMMFGFACNETPSLMPLPIELAHRLTKRLAEVRKQKILPYLLPDGKAQVTLEYEAGEPVRIAQVVVSAQHREEIATDKLRADVMESVILPILDKTMTDDKTLFFINPTGRFVIGGPAGDSGLTGRKIIADTYGGYARHGGGSFSGKDPSKVDRSGAYMARYIAKNIVAAGLAQKCEVAISYAIGLADPLSFEIETFGTESKPIEAIKRLVLENTDLRPRAIINRFSLLSPIYSQLSNYGHFGENAKKMLWEKCDMKEKLKL